MGVQDEISDYITSQSPTKRDDMQVLHRLILDIAPKCLLWFLDGRDARGKVVSNPNIGYGLQTMRAAGGETREFYQIGMSATTTGISIYILGITDKNYLSMMYAKTIGKASVTGYCVKFKCLSDIHINVLAEAIKVGFSAAV